MNFGRLDVKKEEEKIPLGFVCNVHDVVQTRELWEQWPLRLWVMSQCEHNGNSGH